MKDVNLWFWGRGLLRIREVTSPGLLSQEIGAVGLTVLDGNRQQTEGKKETEEKEDGESEPVKGMERGLSLTVNGPPLPNTQKAGCNAVATDSALLMLSWNGVNDILCK